MKTGPGFWLFIAALVALHFFLHLTLGLGAPSPDLLTLAVLLCARQLDPGVAAGVGFGLGVLEDAVSLGAFGSAAIAQTVIGYLGARSRDLFVGESLLFLVFYFFLGSWLQDALYFAVAPGVRRGEPLEALLMVAPLEALYVTVAGVVAITIYRTISR